MENTLKLGFIGGGINSAVGNAHFIASQVDKRFQVEAGCFSRHQAVNIETAERWHVSPERCYDNFQALLQQEKDRLDAIVVLTPTPDHVEPVTQSLRMGYPVICEKALASSSNDAKFIKQVQQEQQGFLTVTYNYTGYPMLRELRNMIRKGSLGRIEQIHIEMPQEGFARVNKKGEPTIPQQWRLIDAQLPTVYLDLGVHIHNIINFLTGEKPVKVVAMQSSLGRFHQVIDNSICLAHYTNGLQCNIWFSKSALGYRNGLRVRVFGEYGAIEWHQMDSEFLLYSDNQGHQMIIDRSNIDVEITNQLRYNRFKAGHPAGFLEAFANLYWDISESLANYQKTGFQSVSDYTFTVNDAWEGLVMLETIAKSSQDYCWQLVNLEGVNYDIVV
jgi:predicted dehydrogenase